MKTRNFLSIILMVLMFFGSFLTGLLPVLAWDPSNIIPDAEFINSQALDATGIQSFLNGRGGTRLRTFSEGGRMAAQIIADAARSNGINPIVILATIQKEESLVDSNTNFDYRVNWAMGYGICDSCSPDDPDVVKYRGFTNQIDNGAWQLKRNYSYWAGNGSSWNVGQTMMIDGVAIRFSNRATSALYRYTPHLHGNENFVSIYGQYRVYTAKGPSGKVAGTKTTSKIKKAVSKTTKAVSKTTKAISKTITKIVSKTSQPKVDPTPTPTKK